ncbi:hypothetical protein [Streptomyces sp. NPDC048737]|uniref:hypothetical protein n=1 Tax=unclassified Streptomyces TaxID=2593676 RepID=UPI00342FBAEE
MGNGGNVRVGGPPAKAGNKRDKAAQRVSPQQQEELRRLRMQRNLELAREAERRRNGLSVAPVRAEKPSSPASSRSVKPPERRKKRASAAVPVKGGKPTGPGVPGLMGKSRKTKARAASHREFPASRPAPVADRGVDHRSALPKIASAYMRLTPEEAQRERQRRLKGETKAEKRRLAKLARKMQAARKTAAGR